jgi:hypothetical protein
MRLWPVILGVFLIVNAIFAGEWLLPSHPDAGGFIGAALTAAFMVFMQVRYGWFPGDPHTQF